MKSDMWKEIESTEVKNAVELFDKDWLVLAAGKEGDFNAMTISWGMMGELWNKDVITVFVRDSRYTKLFMDRFPSFTVSAFPKECRDALKYIGSHSGRDGDKCAQAGLSPKFTELGNPTFNEALLCVECRIVFRQRISSVDGCEPSILMQYRDGDMHTMYIGEIVHVYKRML